MSQSFWEYLTQRIYSMAAYSAFRLHHCLGSSNAAVDTGRHFGETNTTSPAAHRMPTEIILHIIDLAAMAVNTNRPLDLHSTYPLVPAKPNFAALIGLSGSCHIYHTAVQQAWYKVLYMRTPTDREMVDRLGVSIYVR